MITCELCGDRMDPADVLHHLRLVHPDQYDEPQEWPDGSPVIVDTTLGPEDFG